jgi:phosphatidylglycerol:prolipoprotein diacylglycerol transferase
MWPYITLPDFKIWFIPIHWFGILVVIGIYVGSIIARWRAKKLGMNLDVLESFITWMLVTGFVCSHVLDTIFYHPQEVLRRPWSLLMIWEGLSSYGGFIGALLGVLLWKKYRGKGQSIFAMCDLILSAFPIAWIFGRMGCSVVHDHPGRLVSEPTWLTVYYPDGPRYDLGLLEMFLAILISAVVVVLWRFKTRTGTYIAVTSILYAIPRFFLDFWRVEDQAGADPRYFGFTPAQWACVGLLLFGIVVAIRVATGRVPQAPAPAATPEPARAPTSKRQTKRG